jgi:hypothetical protein
VINNEENNLRRPGYFLRQPDGKYDIKIIDKILDQDCIEEMKDLTKVVFALQPIVIAYDVVCRNYDDLKNTLHNLYGKLKALVGGNLFESSFPMSGMTQVSQRVINFLASATSFLNITENHLNHRFGKESSQSIGWNSKRNDLHKEAFAYRFLYELRNFSQHASLPFSLINDKAENLFEDAPTIFKITVLMNPDALLKSNYRWPSSIKNEIKDQSESFDIIPLIGTYYMCLRELCKSAIEARKSDLAVCGHYLMTVENVFELPAGAIPVLFVGDINKTTTPELEKLGLFKFSPFTEIIPFEAFKFILITYQEMNKAN